MGIAQTWHCLVGTLVLCIGSVSYSQTDDPNPRIILKKMIARYESMSSYQDSGTVKVLSGTPLIASYVEDHFKQASFQNDLLVSFKTYYLSPGLFRFEWKSSLTPTLREAVIWSDGEMAYSWMPTIRQKNCDVFILSSGKNLRPYLDQATPSSSGANFFVPSLLMKDATYYSFADMLSRASQLSLLREDEFDGEACYVIKAKISGVPWVLWIGKESYLLRKTRTQYSGGSFHRKVTVQSFIAEETHRDIKINQEISKTVFQYKPRLQAFDIDLTR